MGIWEPGEKLRAGVSSLAKWAANVSICLVAVVVQKLSSSRSGEAFAKSLGATNADKQDTCLMFYAQADMQT